MPYIVLATGETQVQSTVRSHLTPLSEGPRKADSEEN